MIDLNKEKLIGMGQASRLVPARNGKPVAATTVWRWATQGHKGVKLEAMKTPGGEWLTTAGAVGRFLTALAELDAGRPAVDLEAHRRAEEELDAMKV